MANYLLVTDSLNRSCKMYAVCGLSGVLGIRVKIMLPWDPTGKIGPKRPLPDHVSIVEPKNEPNPVSPYSEQKGTKPMTTAPILPDQQPPSPVPQ